MQASMRVPLTKLLQFQELVKLHDLRFLGNPCIGSDFAFVSVSSEHLSMSRVAAFMADWHRTTTPIVEVVATPLTRLRRWVLGRLP